MSTEAKSGEAIAHDLKTLLKRYVQIEDETLLLLAHEIEGLPGTTDEVRARSKDRILSAIELHDKADALVEDAVAKYREDLYFVSRRLAEEDGEESVITGTHVRHAQGLLSRHRKGYSWADGLLALGGLLLGTGLPQLMRATPTTLEIICGFVGALFLGMGAVAKRKD